MANISARFWHTLLLAYGRLLPPHPGSWRVFEKVWPLTQGAWNDPSIVKRDGIWYQLDRKDHIGRHLYYLHYETAETKFLKRRVKPDWVAADVGANIGYFTLLLSRLVGPRGAVYAFEPATPAYQALEKNIALNAAGNVYAYRVALGETCGAVSLVWGPPGSTGKTRLGVSEPGNELTELTTFDTFVGEHGLARLDFIKIDVEGAEERFLDGATKTIKRFQPSILFEVNACALAQFGSTPQSLVERVKGFGYRLYRFGWRGIHPLRDLSEMARHEFFNLVALPFE
jgi:FkbM family methyltransferase